MGLSGLFKKKKYDEPEDTQVRVGDPQQSAPSQDDTLITSNQTSTQTSNKKKSKGLFVLILALVVVYLLMELFLPKEEDPTPVVKKTNTKKVKKAAPAAKNTAKADTKKEMKDEAAQSSQANADDISKPTGKEVAPGNTANSSVANMKTEGESNDSMPEMAKAVSPEANPVDSETVEKIPDTGEMTEKIDEVPDDIDKPVMQAEDNIDQVPITNDNSEANVGIENNTDKVIEGPDQSSTDLGEEIVESITDIIEATDDNNEIPIEDEMDEPKQSGMDQSAEEVDKSQKIDMSQKKEIEDKSVEFLLTYDPPVAPKDKIEFQAPPNYEIFGRGLVYNCSGGHTACVDKEQYLNCRKNRWWSIQNSKDPACREMGVFVSSGDCENAQQLFINRSLEISGCKVN